MDIREHIKVGFIGGASFLFALIILGLYVYIAAYVNYPIYRNIDSNLISFIFIYSLSAFISIRILRPISFINCFFIGFYPTLYFIYEMLKYYISYRDFNLVTSFVPYYILGYISSIIISIMLNKRDKTRVLLG